MPDHNLYAGACYPSAGQRIAAPTGGRRQGAEKLWAPLPQIEMGAGIAASPHCAERRICRCSHLILKPESPKIRSRSWLTSSGVASHLTALSCEKLDRSTDRQPGGSSILQPARPDRSQNNRMFHGPSWGNHSCVPLCFHDPETAKAASRERRSPLPAPLTS